jgi:hypothetical protein
MTLISNARALCAALTVIKAAKTKRSILKALKRAKRKAFSSEGVASIPNMKAFSGYDNPKNALMILINVVGIATYLMHSSSTV